MSLFSAHGPFVVTAERLNGGRMADSSRGLLFQKANRAYALLRRRLDVARLRGAAPMDASDPAMRPRSSDMAARALDARLMMEGGELPLLRFRDFRS